MRGAPLSRFVSADLNWRYPERNRFRPTQWNRWYIQDQDYIHSHITRSMSNAWHFTKLVRGSLYDLTVSGTKQTQTHAMKSLYEVPNQIKPTQLNSMNAWRLAVSKSSPRLEYISSTQWNNCLRWFPEATQPDPRAMKWNAWAMICVCVFRKQPTP